jgi:hypothetical protein
MNEHKIPLPIIVRSPGRGGEREVDHPDQPADFLDDQGHVCRPSDWRLTAKGWQRVYDRVLSSVPAIGRLKGAGRAGRGRPGRLRLPVPSELPDLPGATSGNGLVTEPGGRSYP